MYAAQISKSKTQNELIEYHTDLARAWMELGFYSDAEKVLSECQSLIDRNVNVKPLYESYFYFTYALYNETTGELPRAIELNAKAFSKLSELSVNERKAHFPVDLEAMLKTQKGGLLLKASSIETEVKQSIISKQQLFLTFIITSFFLLAAFSYCLYRNYLKQKLLSQKKEFLIREHHHRVKNNLQAISSMLSLHHYHLTDDVSKAILAESQTRIDSMMLLHRQLYENDSAELVDIETFFQQIIHSVALTFGVYDFHAKVDLEEQFLETDIATSIGVILNELAINSFKHAFPNTPQPLIEVSSKGSGGVIKIRYKDSGKKDIGSLFNNPEKRGFGLSLIGMILYQIDGKMNYHFENGSVFTISFKS
jgi:two-component sensor histidine kinase